MANTQGMQTVSLKAVTAIAATAEWLIVKLDVSNDDAVALATAATDPVYGVIASKPTNTASEVLAIARAGIGKVVLGGTVTRGDWLTADSASKAVAVTSGEGTTNFVLGRALESGVSGVIVAVDINPHQFEI